VGGQAAGGVSGEVARQLATLQREMQALQQENAGLRGESLIQKEQQAQQSELGSRGFL